MSGDDVYEGEMDAPHEFDFDDQAAEALLSGSGRAADPQLADLFDDMRVAYTSQPPAVGAELAAVLAQAGVTTEAAPPRRFERMRSSLVARAAAAAAAMVAATGGLAVAHALPAPMQDAASEIGIGAPAHHGHHAHDTLRVTADDSTTTTDAHTTTTVPHHENDGIDPTGDNDHGAVAGAHSGDNDAQGENECEADDRGELEHGGTVTSTTVPCVPTTGTTVPGSHDTNRGDDNGDSRRLTVSTVPETHDGEQQTSGSSGSGDGEHATTPTTPHSGGGDSQSGSDGGSTSHGGCPARHRAALRRGRRSCRRSVRCAGRRRPDVA